MKKRGVSYVGALDILRRELPLVSQRTEGKKPDKEVLIEVIADVSNEHLWYWQKFGITPQTLSTYMVSSAKSVYTNGSLIMRGTKTNPIFVYPFPSGRLKLYRPLNPARKGKWYGNAQAEDIGGFKQLRRSGIVCFITSSLKDVMLLREMGFNAICFNSETVDVNSDVVKRTVKNLKSRFKFVISFMDNDESGMKSNLKLAQTFRLPYIHTVGPKDLSDFYVRYNHKKTWKFLKKSLKRIYVTYKINEGLVPF